MHLFLLPRIWLEYHKIILGLPTRDKSFATLKSDVLLPTFTAPYSQHLKKEKEKKLVPLKILEFSKYMQLILLHERGFCPFEAFIVII